MFIRLGMLEGAALDLLPLLERWDPRRNHGLIRSALDYVSGLDA